MKWDLLHSQRFYVNVLASAVPFGVAILFVPDEKFKDWMWFIPVAWKLLIFLGVGLLFCAKEYSTLTYVNKTKAINDILVEVNYLKSRLIPPSQKLRVSIFRLKRKGGKKVSVMAYHHNFNGDDDQHIVIPDNMGVTGAVLRGNHQIFANAGDILAKGMYRLPEEDYKKVPSGIKWICGTPIRSKADGHIIAVLDIDGDADLDGKNAEEAKSFARDIADKLGKYF